MLKTTISGLVARKLRLFATALAILLGVAFMAGTFVLTDTIDKTFHDLFGSVYAHTDAVVRGGRPASPCRWGPGRHHHPCPRRPRRRGKRHGLRPACRQARQGAREGH